MNYPEKLTLSVTADDIRKGEQKSASACAVALCGVRSFEDNDGLTVTSEDIEVYGLDGSYAVYKPEDTTHARFVEDFDSGEPVQPTTLVYSLDSTAPERD